MTPEAEKFNGWAAMIGFVAALGAYITTGQIIPGIFLIMSLEVGQTIIFCLTPLACLLFVTALLDDNHDDDDQGGGGLMQPVWNPTA